MPKLLKKGQIILTYNLYVLNKRKDVYEKKGEYKTRDRAEKKEKSYKNKDTKIIFMPDKKDIKIGFEIYNDNDELYGTIVRESNYFWYVNRTFGEENPIFFLKDSFLEKYEKSIFKMKKGRM